MRYEVRINKTVPGGRSLASICSPSDGSDPLDKFVCSPIIIIWKAQGVPQ